MPSGTLPNAGSLGDPQIATGDYQTQINQLLDYVRSLQSEVALLSGTTIKEGAVRGVGTAADELVETSQLHTRLGTSGNLGTAAQADTGTLDTEVPTNADLGSASNQDYSEQVVTLGGDFGASQVRCVRVGRLVCISAVGSFIDHADGFAQPTSQAGVIPSEFRPPSGTSVNIYNQDASAIGFISCDSSGNFALKYREYISSNSLTPRNASMARPSITYTV